MDNQQGSPEQGNPQRPEHSARTLQVQGKWEALQYGDEDMVYTPVRIGEYLCNTALGER